MQNLHFEILKPGPNQTNPKSKALHPKAQAISLNWALNPIYTA